MLLPTPVPTDGALPLPPVPSASITSELNEAAYNLWSDDRKVMVIKWDYGWPDGVAKLETTGIAGLTTWTAGQTPHKSTEVCWPSEAGRTFRYSVSLRTFGNGVTYRAAWSDWSETCQRHRDVSRCTDLGANGVGYTDPHTYATSESRCIAVAAGPVGVH